MNRPKISILVATSNRPEMLRTCIKSILSQNHSSYEIIILDSSSEIDSCSRINDLTSDDRIHCTNETAFRGVAGSRNWLVENADGEILVFIDDDAYFPDSGALSSIESGFERETGIQAFKIIDNPSGQNRKVRVPVKNRAMNNIDINSRFKVSYYIGAGHAIKREIFETCGTYVDNFVYGSEELDLSYRVISNGFNIVYNPDVVVHHNPQQPVVSAETTGHTELYYRTANRIFMAYKYLPLKYITTYLLSWMSYFFIDAIRKGDIPSYFYGIFRGIKSTSSVNRTPIDSRTEEYLKQNHGRLWY
ncbi:glycosyltransferase [Haloarcula sp. S1AR25-5A]|uniref:Glycosyltransferase n=1 Tax=Haloarcula terrestris TaxID=2950533 RepID=A0AAE4JIC2_9EURY|nr:glycosyltransferase [Haloarcula terrestris]MDS0220941.1 glycosyltransferase [Haloarcula terrestris]